ncbi:ras-like GTP-binding protein rhoA [Patella vulgata]|uniref:ras-like GTP-binding protein rhoA n=1 Tax=Patella vulgata TaxID=6465 RepID=UPI0024A88DB8|nr:ras-like GTP-binding protein rhoA [Patella vulgata]
MFFCCLGRSGEKEEKIVRRKLVIVGDGECGKTCLLHRYTRDQFLPDIYIPTVFDTCVKDVISTGKQVELVLHDTAGQEDFEVLRPLSYPESDVIVLCFSVDYPDSLENVVQHWATEIRHYCGDIPIILVGNKIDLRSESPSQKQKFVTYEKGHHVAERIGAAVYCECSAKFDAGVTEVFEEAVRVAMIKRSCRKR